MYPRLISLPIGKRSFFLFGPRQTGKTTLIEQALVSRSNFSVNLFATDIFLRYSRDPSQFRREVEHWALANPRGIVFLDEIQRLPALLNEIQILYDHLQPQITFIMTGSSARKLKRTGANLLGGRALSYALFPLTHKELKEQFKLADILLYGSLPPLIDQTIEDKIRTLKAYIEIYLKEEIMHEALVRNMPAFNKVLELAADQSGLPVNYSNFAAETGVASKTIRDYYQVLEDTLLAFPLQPYLKSARSRLTTHPVYYLFDLGVINALCGRLRHALVQGSSLYGRLFEHFVMLEMRRLAAYNEKDWAMYYWRTSSGSEVDVILERGHDRWAIEIKSAENVHLSDLRGLKRFLNDYHGFRGMCVCNAPRPYSLDNITCLPWHAFFDELTA